MIVSRLCFTKRRKELSVQKEIPSEGPAERAEKDYFYSKNLPICDPEDDTEMKERGKDIGELKQPRRARRQECHKFAYLTKKEKQQFRTLCRWCFYFVHFAVNNRGARVARIAVHLRATYRKPTA